VVDVPVREQHRGRLESVLGEDRLQGVGHADARVDDQALLARARREDVAVRGEGGRGKRNGQHRPSLTVTPS
jgi:hypothetical protein